MKASRNGNPTHSGYVADVLCTDVLQLILEMFDPGKMDDRATLQALSLVSHFFAARCQPLLFREIFLCDIRGTPHEPLSKGFTPIGKRCKVLMRLLTSRPHLIELIQRVKVGMSGGYEKGLGKIKEFQALLTMLFSQPGIRGPQAFHIVGECFISNKNSFEKNVFYPFLATRITALCIDAVWNLPMAVIAHCENLEDLTLIGKYAKLDEDSVSIPILINGGPKIKVLRHTGPTPVLQCLLTDPVTGQPFIDLKSLKQYRPTFKSPSADIPLFATVCSIGAQSLASIVLTVDLFNETLPDTQGFDLLDFSHCWHVELMKLDLTISLVQPSDCLSRLHDVAAALQTFPKCNDLRKLILQLHIHSAQYYPNFLKSSKVAWITLDAELKRISDHKPVSVEVLIKYSTDVYHPSNEEMANELEGVFRNIISECLALTRERQEGSFALLFEFVNECYSHASYCRRWLHY
ncbi:hypothetical protein CVT24_012517 [Panaeolus cyanescens]|uniref:Uncharacterized protein n=1 Tax=Panaeolus cyanescens TaxID=181874 RepID=A0A409YK41_9AGAR|nr:hypothetical protein CVT24_012517 [Panaeolus cyanescens]